MKQVFKIKKLNDSWTALITDREASSEYPHAICKAFYAVTQGQDFMEAEKLELEIKGEIKDTRPPGLYQAPRDFSIVETGSPEVEQFRDKLPKPVTAEEVKEVLGKVREVKHMLAKMREDRGITCFTDLMDVQSMNIINDLGDMERGVADAFYFANELDHSLKGGS